MCSGPSGRARRQPSLTTVDSDARNCTAVGGASGAGSGAPGAGGSDATPVFSDHGTINGNAVAGPAPGALGTSVP